MDNPTFTNINSERLAVNGSANGVTSQTKVELEEVPRSLSNSKPAERDGKQTRSTRANSNVPDEVLERHKTEREKQPIFYIRWIVKRPKTWFGKLAVLIYLITHVTAKQLEIYVPGILLFSVPSCRPRAHGRADRRTGGRRRQRPAARLRSTPARHSRQQTLPARSRMGLPERGE